MDGINTFQELEPNTIVQNLVEYVETELVNFITSDESKNVLKKKKNENQHSLAFCLYMTNKCSSKFYFGRENSQKGSSVVDIGIYHGSNLFFTIESKVLPTPKGTKSYPRNEYEYVYGKGGGIYRFKERNHGLDNEDENLPENGLIAFVKESEYKFWLGKINKWIIDASWNKSEKLQKVYFSTTAKLHSNHSRIDGSNVVLHHFWVKVS